MLVSLFSGVLVYQTQGFTFHKTYTTNRNTRTSKATSAALSCPRQKLVPLLKGRRVGQLPKRSGTGNWKRGKKKTLFLVKRRSCEFQQVRAALYAPDCWRSAVLARSLQLKLQRFVIWQCLKVAKAMTYWRWQNVETSSRTLETATGSF